MRLQRTLSQAEKFNIVPSEQGVETPPGDHLDFWNHSTGEKADKIKRAPGRILSTLGRPAKMFSKCSSTSTTVPCELSLEFSGAIDRIDTFDRKVNVFTKSTYRDLDACAHFGEDDLGKKIPKLKASAEIGIGLARAEISVFEAEARGPNASATVEASQAGVQAMVGASAGSITAGVGPVSAKLGLGLDTGVAAGPDGLEVKVLGTGFSVGRKTGVSILGSELKISR